MGNPTLTILLPCYNPPKEWIAEVNKYWQIIDKQLVDSKLQLVIVNDGSTQKQWLGLPKDYLDSLQKALPKNTYLVHYTQNKGKGYALRRAVEMVSSDYYIFTDIDFPFELEGLFEMYEKLKSGTDILIGTRQNYDQQLKPQRKLLSWFSHFLNRHVFRLPFTDTQGGLKGFNERGKTIFCTCRANRYLFDTEFIVKSIQQNGLTIETIPIVTRPGIVFSEMRFSLLLKEGRSLLSLFHLCLFRKNGKLELSKEAVKETPRYFSFIDPYKM